jgi:hypothetical protein
MTAMTVLSTDERGAAIQWRMNGNAPAVIAINAAHPGLAEELERCSNLQGG